MRTIFAALALLLVAACQPAGYAMQYGTNDTVGGGFWKPVSSPNVMLPVDQAQTKLEHDLRLCRCGGFPTNVPTPIRMQMNPDQARLAETSNGEQCLSLQQPVLMECMRARGWQPTLCNGRMATDGSRLCPM